MEVPLTPRQEEQREMFVPPLPLVVGDLLTIHCEGKYHLVVAGSQDDQRGKV